MAKRRNTAEQIIIKLRDIEVHFLCNGYCESFNAHMRDKLLNGELFDTLFKAEVLTKKWTEEYNTIRPHSSLGYKPLAPAAWIQSA